MPFSHQAPRVVVTDRAPTHLQWVELKEMISASELPEDASVEWMLDHARSNDGARP